MKLFIITTLVSKTVSSEVRRGYNVFTINQTSKCVISALIHNTLILPMQYNNIPLFKYSKIRSSSTENCKLLLIF